MIGALVVDDSAFMRRAIVKMLESAGDIKVIATAQNGEEAVTKTLALRPDVVTMDVEMPGMTGLEAVERIVAQAHVPIIMVSAHTREGAEITFRALELGAVDFITKPDAAYADIEDVARDLVEKVRGCAGRAHVALPAAAKGIVRYDGRSERREERSPYECVAIGASTGGPAAIKHILTELPSDFPAPILVVQHMPAGFTQPFAARLDAQTQIAVREGADGMVLQPGCATIAPAGKQLSLRRASEGVTIRLLDDADALHAPSVDALGDAVATAYERASVGVILTGMGRDGVAGMRRIRERGGYVVGQDEATSVVYGMPRAAMLAGLVDRAAALFEIAPILCGLVRVPWSSGALEVT